MNRWDQTLTEFTLTEFGTQKDLNADAELSCNEFQQNLVKNHPQCYKKCDDHT